MALQGQKGHHVGSGGSSKGKKHPSTPVKKAIVHPEKRRWLISDDENKDEDDIDEPLVKRVSK